LENKPTYLKILTFLLAVVLTLFGTHSEFWQAVPNMGKARVEAGSDFRNYFILNSLLKK